ncbi:MAG TPA: TrkA family potassium uptake protein [Clostridia bacterium]|nr:TrkA family potassium uptake protein [Clostridia bacterium]
MNSYLVLGLGRFGKAFAKTLSELGHDVLGVDRNPQVVQDVSEELAHVITSEISNEEFLKSIGVSNFDAAVVAIGNDLQSSILTTALLKELGAKYIISKAQNDLHAKVLMTVGANRVIFPERDMGIRVANNLASHNIIDSIQLSGDHSIMETSIPEKWVGKTINELAIRAKYKVNILAVRKGDTLDISPGADYVFKEDDIVSIMGKNKDLKDLQHIK